MIRINLAKRKTASLAAEQAGSGGGLLSRLRDSLRGGTSGGASLAYWPIRAIMIALVAIYGSQFFFENEKASRDRLPRGLDAGRTRRAFSLGLSW